MNKNRENYGTHEMGPVSYEKSRKLAEELLDRFNEEIRDNIYKDVDSWGEPYTDFQTSIKHFLKETPETVLEHYGAHGITRGDEIDRLAAALNILANKSIKGEYGPLGGETHGYGARQNADFLVVSKLDKPLAVKKEVTGDSRAIFNEIGWIADIGAFVVDVCFYPLVPELKKMFPDINIIYANELPGYFERNKKSA